MEDESGPINVIVKPNVYEKFRMSIRMEPFLIVRGRLQKDGRTMNVIAHEVRAIRVQKAARPEALHSDLPETLEWWSEPEERGTRTLFRYLTALRQSPPGIKSFG
jgi:error-prone DNA polymerase